MGVSLEFPHNNPRQNAGTRAVTFRTSFAVRAIVLFTSVALVAGCGLPRSGPNKREVLSGSVDEKGDASGTFERVTKTTNDPAWNMYLAGKKSPALAGTKDAKRARK